MSSKRLDTQKTIKPYVISLSLKMGGCGVDSSRSDFCDYFGRAPLSRGQAHPRERGRGPIRQGRFLRLRDFKHPTTRPAGWY